MVRRARDNCAPAGVRDGRAVNTHHTTAVSTAGQTRDRRRSCLGENRMWGFHLGFDGAGPMTGGSPARGTVPRETM